MGKAHSYDDLRQMQAMPLEYKIRATQERIEAWYQSWWRYEIEDQETGKTRSITLDNRDPEAEPPLTPSEWIKSAKPGAVYVSFSGGKDSTVLKHIVDSMYDDVPAVFINTGLEYPEIQHFVREIKAGKYACFNADIDILQPDMCFDEVIKRSGYPVISKEISYNVYYARSALKAGKAETRALKKLRGELRDKNGCDSRYNCKKYEYLIDAPFRVSNLCCDIMKKRPADKYSQRTGRQAIIGTLASESRLRLSEWLEVGCNAFDAKKPTSKPLSFWTDQDVLQYMQKYNVPLCQVYGRIEPKDPGGVIGQLAMDGVQTELCTTGCDRTGCVYCMFGCHLEKEPNRFQRLKETHPRQYAYCIGGGEMVEGMWQPTKEGLGLGFVLDYIGVKY